MKILKFGGTSVGSPERMRQVLQLIQRDQDTKIVVLSAVTGTTNALVAISEEYTKGNKEAAKILITKLEESYRAFCEALAKGKPFKAKAHAIIDEHFTLLRSKESVQFSDVDTRELLAQGELISTKLFMVLLEEEGVDAKWWFAPDFMRIDEDKEPVILTIRQGIQSKWDEQRDHKIYITQGYICYNELGELDNLKRGGSDYTATLIGAAISASEVQIWTDIDGMHNNDPRIVEKTFPIAELSFDEASELAYFGAKILHPTSIWPVQKYNVPVRLLNTMQPEAKGTYISTSTITADIKALAAKDGITAIKIKSSRMILAYGFLTKIFEIFERYKTPIDMITTSEVAVSVTIDDHTHIEAIVEELQYFSTVEVDYNQTIICIVGNMVSDSKGIVKKVFDALEDIPVRMISYGGSKHNISVLVDVSYKIKALKQLNAGLFS